MPNDSNFRTFPVAFEAVKKAGLENCSSGGDYTKLYHLRTDVLKGYWPWRQRDMLLRSYRRTGKKDMDWYSLKKQRGMTCRCYHLILRGSMSFLDRRHSMTGKITWSTHLMRRFESMKMGFKYGSTLKSLSSFHAVIRMMQLSRLWANSQQMVGHIWHDNVHEEPPVPSVRRLHTHFRPNPKSSCRPNPVQAPTTRQVPYAGRCF